MKTSLFFVIVIILAFFIFLFVAYKVDSNGKKVKGKWSAKKAIKVKK